MGQSRVPSPLLRAVVPSPSSPDRQGEAAGTLPRQAKMLVSVPSFLPRNYFLILDWDQRLWTSWIVTKNHSLESQCLKVWFHLVVSEGYETKGQMNSIRQLDFFKNRRELVNVKLTIILLSWKKESYYYPETQDSQNECRESWANKAACRDRGELTFLNGWWK